MIKLKSILKVCDNSGAKIVKCLGILGGFKKKHAVLGDFIMVSIRQLRNKFKISSKVKKKEVCKALIIRTKVAHVKKTGIALKFNENAVVLINKQGNPIGTRIIGPIPKTLQKKAFQKFISIANGLI